MFFILQDEISWVELTKKAGGSRWCSIHEIKIFLVYQKFLSWTKVSYKKKLSCPKNLYGEPAAFEEVVPSWVSSWAFLRHTKVSQSERVVSWEPDPNFSRVLLSGKGVQNILALFVWQLNIFMEKVRFSIFHYESWL